MDRIRNALKLTSCLLITLSCLSVPNVNAGGLLERITDGRAPFNLGSSEPEFLDPEIAFRFSQTSDQQGLLFNWEIANGYYLYKDRFKLSSQDTGVIARFTDMPAGEMKNDPEFGHVEIYRDQVTLNASINSTATPNAAVDIEVIYQGCAEDGICYPPIKKNVTIPKEFFADQPLNLNQNGVAAKLANTQSTSSGVLSADRLADQLKDRNLLSTVAIFFGFGLLLSFTPCVFPMLPILSGIIVGQKQPVSTGRAFRLSLSYVLAMAATYAIVGVIAGMFGHNLQATFQQPLWIIGFSIVFVFLALSMFGFFDLALPTSWQSKLDQISRAQTSGSYGGVAVMGVLSAIIVGPCVAPPFAAALLYLSHQGNPLFGGTALFAMALGMGALLLIAGTAAGSIVPRSGAWMEGVKHFFGVMLLGVAIWFLGRIVPGPVSLGLWSALFVISAVYLGALESVASRNVTGGNLGTGWLYLRKGTGLLALVYGITLLVGASAGGNDPLRPLAPFADAGSKNNHQLSFATIKSTEDLDTALGRAKNNNQFAMLDFYADWCIECKHLEKSTFGDQQVQAALGAMILLRADVTNNDALDQSLLKRFELFGPPAILFFEPTGAERRDHRVVGFLNADQFLRHLQTLTVNTQ